MAKPRGKPFKKGTSGNPGGRPHLPKHVRDLARSHTEEAIATLVTIMRDENEKGSPRARAAEAILDRAWGTPASTIALTGAEAAPIQGDDARAELKAIIDAIAVRQAENGSGDDVH